MEGMILDPILAAMDRLILAPSLEAFLDDTMARLRSSLAREEVKAFLPLAVEDFPGIPDDIGLIRLFGLKVGQTGPRERHPNSYQRVMSLAGSGCIQVWTAEGTASVVHSLRSDQEGHLAVRWSCVPPGLWHQPSAGPEEDWIALVLHTAQEGVLIDEYDSPDVW